MNEEQPLILALACETCPCFVPLSGIEGECRSDPPSARLLKLTPVPVPAKLGGKILAGTSNGNGGVAQLVELQAMNTTSPGITRRSWWCSRHPAFPAYAEEYFRKLREQASPTTAEAAQH